MTADTQLSFELGISLSVLDKEFRKWCRERGIDPEQFKVRTEIEIPGGTIELEHYEFPDEFVEYVRKRAMRIKAKYILGEDKVWLADVARIVGMPKSRVARLFKWWCSIRGKDPKEFYVSGFGYYVPKDFIFWLINFLKG